MKVKIKKFKKRPFHWNRKGKMDKYMGKIINVTDCGQWLYEQEGIRRYVYQRRSQIWSFMASDFTIVKEKKQ